MKVQLAGPANSRHLALLLGWTGGSLRHLRKHEVLWHELGYRTISAANTFDMTFMPEQVTCIRKVASQILDRIEDHRARVHQRSIVCAHSFSNGGMLLFLTMLAEARQRQPSIYIDAAVYDSAPSRRIDPIAAPLVICMSGAPFVSQALPQLLRITPYSILAQLASPFVGVARPIGAFAEVRDPVINAPRPELFVFSDADWLVGPAGVIDFAAHREACGSRVELLHLKTSPHVGHYRAFPKEYTAAVSKLLDKL